MISLLIPLFFGKDQENKFINLFNLATELGFFFKKYEGA